MSTSKETGIGTDPDNGNKVQLDTDEKIAIRDLLEERLKECGWRRDVEQKIRDTLQERGLENVTREQLTAEIYPEARALVPDSIRKEMVERVRKALEGPLTPPSDK